MMPSNSIFQNSYYVGNQFLCVGFGIEVVLYYLSVYHLARDERSGAGTRNKRLFIAFSTALLILFAINVVVQVAFGQEMWIIHVDYPGGSAMYLADHLTVWYQTMGAAAFDLMSLFSDAFLIYRSYVVWGGWRIIILPCFLWVASLGVGTAQLVVASLPGGDFIVGLAADIGLVYYCILVANNIFLTTILCVRVWNYSRTAGKVFGEDARSKYARVASVVVESAMPYTLSGIALIIVQGMESDLAIFFQSTFAIFACLSPQMLVYRVVLGREWNNSQNTPYFETTSSAAGGRSLHDTTQTGHSNDSAAIHLRSLNMLNKSFSVDDSRCRAKSGV